MKDTDVLQQAIEKARAGGWKDIEFQYVRCFKEQGRMMVEFLITPDEPLLTFNYEAIVFSHSFAESLWGMDTMYYVVHVDKGAGMENSIIGWKSEKEMEAIARERNIEYYDDMPVCEYHLQQLVIEESQDLRVAYIEKYL